MPKRRNPSGGKSAAAAAGPARDDFDVRLRRAEERFRLFMENVKEYAVFMLDPSGRVVDWNVGAEHVLGYGSEIVGQPFDIFFPEDDRKAGVPERELKKAADTGQASDDRWHVRKNGSYFWALGITTAMRDEHGTLRGFAKVIRDSTERKRFEEQLREKNEALEEADRLKDEFLAMLAHELRNPLAPIFHALSVLEREQSLTDIGRQARSIVERQTLSLARLVDDLLDVSRVTTGKIQLASEVIDFGTIISHAVDAYRPQLDARKHRVTLSLPSEPLWLEADRTRIEQVITNLLSNASKYSDDCGSIALAVAREGSHAVLRVRDRGIGIPADFLPRIFDLFVQGDGSLTRAQGGLGVGLALVRKLVEMHGGTVRANSEGLGEGSEFVVSLPLREETARSAASEEGFSAPAQAKEPLRVVVVDDNADAAESLGMVLSLAGHDVRTVTSASQAVAVAREHRPDAMFIDIRMPGLSGYQLAERLRQAVELRDTVLIATTGFGQEEARTLGGQAGFAHYLVKPIDSETVEQLLASIAGLKG
jgi:PAS domain S-box-containing protein